jgi:hypothetical protein
MNLGVDIWAAIFDYHGPNLALMLTCKAWLGIIRARMLVKWANRLKRPKMEVISLLLGRFGGQLDVNVVNCWIAGLGGYQYLLDETIVEWIVKRGNLLPGVTLDGLYCAVRNINRARIFIPIFIREYTDQLFWDHTLLDYICQLGDHKIYDDIVRTFGRPDVSLVGTVLVSYGYIKFNTGIAVHIAITSAPTTFLIFELMKYCPFTEEIETYCSRLPFTWRPSLTLNAKDSPTEAFRRMRFIMRARGWPIGDYPLALLAVIGHPGILLPGFLISAVLTVLWSLLYRLCSFFCQ